MNESLRPRDLGSILDFGVQVFRQRPMVFFKLGSISSVFQVALALVTDHQRASGGSRLGTTFASLSIEIASLIVNAVVMAALCFAAAAVNFGEVPTVSGAVNRFSFRPGSLAGLAILQDLLIFWPLVVAVIPALILFIAMKMHLVGVLLQMCLWGGGIALCVYLYARYALAFPVTAVENLPASYSLKRSVALGRGSRMKIALAVLVPLLLEWTLIFGSILLFAHYKNQSLLFARHLWVLQTLRLIVGVFATVVFVPYRAIVLTLLYYDQRIRREGYDLERMMDAAGLNPNATAPLTTAPAPAASPALAAESAQEQQA